MTVLDCGTAQAPSTDIFILPVDGESVGARVEQLRGLCDKQLRLVNKNERTEVQLRQMARLVNEKLGQPPIGTGDLRGRHPFGFLLRVSRHSSFSMPAGFPAVCLSEDVIAQQSAKYNAVVDYLQ